MNTRVVRFQRQLKELVVELKEEFELREDRPGGEAVLNIVVVSHSAFLLYLFEHLLGEVRGGGGKLPAEGIANGGVVAVPLDDVLTAKFKLPHEPLSSEEGEEEEDENKMSD